MHRRALLIAAVLAATSLTAHAAPPVIAVVASNDGTETTDFLIPFGVLSRAGVAEVSAVALREGVVELHTGLEIEVGETVASFDARQPGGADFVIVPAMMYPEAPALLSWLRGQAARGATLVSICDGAFVLAHAGLLDGHEATAHWASLGELAAKFPKVRWVRDRRWVDTGSVITTAGVSASIPASLALVERIAGRERATEVAAGLAEPGWSAVHDTSAFRFDAARIETAATNWLAFWRHERVGIPIADGVDEIALGLAADAFARTWRAEPVALASSTQVVTRHGLRVAASAGPVDRRYELPPANPFVASPLDRLLADIATYYGVATANFVAVQMEYPCAP
jgi:putative intracellular protease/amidase